MGQTREGGGGSSTLVGPQYFAGNDFFPIKADHPPPVSSSDHGLSAMASDHGLSCVEYVRTQEIKTCILKQSQKFKKGLKTAQVLASLVSEGGMSTFTRRHQILESSIKSWKHGREVVVQEIEGVPESNSEQDVQSKEERNPQGAINVTIDEGDPLTDQEVSEAEGETKPACDDNNEERLDENTLTIPDDEREEKKPPDFLK